MRKFYAKYWKKSGNFNTGKLRKYVGKVREICQPEMWFHTLKNKKAVTYGKAYGTADKTLLALLFVIFELTLSSP